MTLVALLIMLVHFFISSQSCAQEIQPEIQIFIVFRGSCLSVLLLVDDQAKILFISSMINMLECPML